MHAMEWARLLCLLPGSELGNSHVSNASVLSTTQQDTFDPTCPVSKCGRSIRQHCRNPMLSSSLSAVAQAWRSRCRCVHAMAAKTPIRVDITSDVVCPWCYVGKENLEKAMAATSDHYDFQVWWHPFMLNPDAPKQGMEKREHYERKFGPDRTGPMFERMSKVFADLGLTYSLGGLTGNTLDSHRLIHLAGRQGWEKQNALVAELFANYHSQEKYIGDRQVLLDAAQKVGVENAKEFLDNPTAGLSEVNQELQKFARGVTGVPHFLINSRHPLSGAQSPNTFIQAFHWAASST